MTCLRAAIEKASDLPFSQARPSCILMPSKREVPVLKTWWIAGLVVGWIVVCVVSGGAASWSGTHYAQGEVYPELGLGGGGTMTLVGSGWSVTETSAFSVWPAPSDSEWLEIAFESGALTFAATSAFSVVALSYDSLDLALIGNLGSLDVPAENPLFDVTASITAGATLEEGVSPYACLEATASMGSHYLYSATTLYAHPANLESLIDAYLSIFKTTLGDAGHDLSVSLCAYGETYVVPLEFSYAYLKSTISLGDLALSGHVTYYGESTFTLKLRVSMSFGPIELWGTEDSDG